MSGPLRNQVLTGDALTQLRFLPDARIDCIITSPPYFRLRDYGHGDQLGLESHVDAWVAQLRAVLTECAVSLYRLALCAQPRGGHLQHPYQRRC